MTEAALTAGVLVGAAVWCAAVGGMRRRREAPVSSAVGGGRGAGSDTAAPAASLLADILPGPSRSQLLTAQLPEWLELLAMAVGGGLGLYQALRRVQPLLRPPLADEVARLLAERSAGRGLQESVETMAARVDVAGIERVADALGEAMQGGAPLGEVLRTQAASARERQRRSLERQVRLLPLKLTLITVFFFVPAMLAVVLVPNILSYLSSPW